MLRNILIRDQANDSKNFILNKNSIIRIVFNVKIYKSTLNVEIVILFYYQIRYSLPLLIHLLWIVLLF